MNVSILTLTATIHWAIVAAIFAAFVLLSAYINRRLTAVQARRNASTAPRRKTRIG